MSKIIDKLAKGVSFIWTAIDKNAVLSFNEVKEKSVVISFLNKELFGIKLESTSNKLIEADMEFVFDKAKSFDDAQMLLNIIRNDKEYNVYIYSTNQKLASLLATSFKTNLMSGKEIVYSFADYYFLNSYTIKNNTLPSWGSKIVGVQREKCNSFHPHFINLKKFIINKSL